MGKENVEAPDGMFAAVAAIWLGSTFWEKLLILAVALAGFCWWCYARYIYPLRIEDRKNQREFEKSAQVSDQILARTLAKRSGKKGKKDKTDD